MGIFSKSRPPEPSAVTEAEVRTALKRVIEPELHKDIVSLNMVKGVSVCGGAVKVSVELTTPACPLKKEIEESVRREVGAIAGVEAVNVELTANVKGSRAGAPALPGLKNVLAVSSGKGGVGKSTVATNLAVALARTGASVGLLDADLYGPNIPNMLGIDPSTKPVVKEKRLQPLEAHGVKSMSIGYLLHPEQAVVWRGPMLHKAIQQFLGDVEWGELDYLVVDLPPGTGDAQLSLSQLVPLAGAVVVTTPQTVSVVDVEKAIRMFRQVHVDVLGVVENMAGFVCSHCRKETEIFGTGGAARLAEEFGIPILGRIPLDPAVRLGGDAGEPIVVASPDSPVSRAFSEIAGKVAAALSVKSAWALPVLQ
jgi:ATP-binding protein involved in chromosome partitioning